MAAEHEESVAPVPPYVLGVDGGTSKTIALVADSRGRVLGAGRGGNSNWTGPDVERPMAVVAETVRQALTGAGLSGSDIEVGVFCLAGADWPEDHTRRQAVLQRSDLARRVVVKNDALAGWRAGTSTPFGVVIAAGTGTNTGVIAPDGREWLYGYYALQGGGHDIAEEAIGAVLREEDGRGAPTRLTRVVLEQLGLPNAEALLRVLIAHELPRERVLPLCPLVFEAALAGDAVAADILVKQGLVLAEYATAAIRRFGMEQLEFDVVLAGSVFKGRGPLLVDTITQAIHRVAPRARVVRQRLEPAAGAVLLAYDALGIVTSMEIMHNLECSLPPASFFRTSDPSGRSAGA